MIYQFDFTIVIIVSLLVLTFGILSSESLPSETELINRLNPSELMILSILDFNNDAVVRDLISMVRSLRIFGGTLNDAKVIVGVISRMSLGDTLSFSIEDFTVLSELGQLGVEIEFLQGVGKSPQSRTMNKLEAFRLFDPLRFSHVLWLDADILILGDPLPSISRHSYPGSIDCVPELYSYMIRYPELNTTRFAWNPELSPVTLLGYNEEAPAGTCNTGVLMIDSVILPQLIEEMELIDKEKVIPEVYHNDRFLDSLYFVLAVNRKGIHMNYWSYEFNYMAFFIGEYAEFQLELSNIYFAHFLWEPYFYCRVLTEANVSKEGSTTKQCECLSRNEHQRDEDILYRSIDRMIVQNNSVCRFMAGDYSTALADNIMEQQRAILMAKPLGNIQPSYHSQLQDVNTSFINSSGIFDKMNSSCTDEISTIHQLSFECNPLWPPLFQQEKLIHPAQTVSIKIILQCVERQHMNNAAFVQQYSLYDIQQIRGRLRLSLDEGDVSLDLGQDVLFTEFKEDDKISGKNESIRYFTSVNLDINVQIPDDHDRSARDRSHQGVDDSHSHDRLSSLYKVINHKFLTIAFRYALDMTRPEEGVDGRSLCIDVQSGVNHRGEIFTYNNLILSRESLFLEHQSIDTIKTMFVKSPLQSSRLLSLSTQLLLPEYLVTMSLLPPISSTSTLSKSFRSVLFCCDSNKGIQTIQRLLQKYSSVTSLSITTLIIFMSLPENLPFSSVTNSSEIINHYFGTYCSLLVSDKYLDFHESGNHHCQVISLLVPPILNSSQTPTRIFTFHDVGYLLQSLRSRSYHLVYWDIQPFSKSPWSISQFHASSAIYPVLQRLFDEMVRILAGNNKSLWMGSSYYAEADLLKVMEENSQIVYPISVMPTEIGNVPKSAALSPYALASFLMNRQLVAYINIKEEKPPLFTFAEALPSYCVVGHESPRWWQECAPAWYFWV